MPNPNVDICPFFFLSFLKVFIYFLMRSFLFAHTRRSVMVDLPQHDKRVKEPKKDKIATNTTYHADFCGSRESLGMGPW